MNRQLPGAVARAAAALSATVVGIALCYATPSAQDRLKTMPGYDQYQKMSRELRGCEARVDQRPVERGQRKRRVRARRQAVSLRRRGTQRDRARPGRGRRPVARAARRRARRHGHRARTAVRVRRFARRQAQGVLPRSQPVGERRRRQQRVADHDRRQREGSHQVRHGELGLRRGARPDDAMWWSPDSRKLAFYRFDEKPVPDFYLQMDQTQVQSTLDVEAYPKAGAPNPIVDLFVYDVAARRRAIEGRRARRQAVRQRRDRPLRLQRVAGRRTARSCS